MPSAIAKLRIETKVAFGCVGLMAICALVMLFNGAHRTSVAISASQALVGLLLAFNAAKKDRKQPIRDFSVFDPLMGKIRSARLRRWPHPRENPPLGKKTSPRPNTRKWERRLKSAHVKQASASATGRSRGRIPYAGAISPCVNRKPPRTIHQASRIRYRGLRKPKQ